MQHLYKETKSQGEIPVEPPVDIPWLEDCVEEKEFYPLSPLQERLFISQQQDAGGTGGNMPLFLEVEGAVCYHDIKAALLALIDRHESYRTFFDIVDGRPVQRIIAPGQIRFPFDWCDLSQEPAEIQVKKIAATIRDFVTPFDVRRPPLLRVAVIKTSSEKQLLLVDTHRLIADHRSTEMFILQFAALCNGQAPEPVTTRYRDYAVWQRKHHTGPVLKQQQLYWSRRFDGEIPVLELPCDFSRPVARDCHAAHLGFTFGEELSAKLNDICHRTHVSLFMLMLAVYNVFLAKLSGSEDIVVGTAASGPRPGGLENVIGAFAGVLALRNFPHSNTSFYDFLIQLNENTSADFINGDYPFEIPMKYPEAGIGDYPVTGIGSHQQMFRTVFNLLSVNHSASASTGVSIKPFICDHETSPFDLSLLVMELGDHIDCELHYAISLFKPETIRRFSCYITGIADAVATDPKQRIGDIDYIPQQEKRQLRILLNERATTYPGDRTLTGLFEVQQQKTPQLPALAVVETNAGHFTVSHDVSYHELNRRASDLAVFLVSHGAGAHGFIGILMDAAAGMITGLLGILKSGNAYVPLDPKAPAARNIYILKECAVNILLTSRRLSGSVDALSFDGLIIYLDEMGEMDERDEMNEMGERGEVHGTGPDPRNRIGPEVHPSDYAYVIFTSGSTGRPKGVPITHANLSPLLHWGFGELDIGPDDRAFQNISYCFDWSVWEIFIILSRGAVLYVTPQQLRLNPEAGARFIGDNHINILHVTPGQWQYWVDATDRYDSLRLLLIGAEKLSGDLVKRSIAKVTDRCRIFNMYGPTEATIIASVMEIDNARVDNYEHISSFPIGGPVGNTDLLVLDKELKPVPLMVEGQLVIVGDGVAHGYLNKPDLSSDFFVTLDHEGQRTGYKTGDRVRCLPDGVLEFLGRFDFQVKIRGYRIELGEIEQRLLTHESVKDAVVVAREHAGGENYLCAYVIADASQDIDSGVLRAYLSHSLPDYMVPACFMYIDSFPLTPNGKIHRQALPEPEEPQSIPLSDRDSILYDENHIRLLELWQEVLGHDHFDMAANFFEAGGHSLSAVRLVAKIKELFRVDFPLQVVFEKPYIGEQLEFIRGAGASAPATLVPVEEKEYYPASPVQRRLFALNGFAREGTDYNMPEAVRIAGDLSIPKLSHVLRCLVARHDSLRTSFRFMANQLVQVVHETVNFDIRFINNAGVSEAPPELSSLIRPFDLSRAPLLRVVLLEESVNRHILFCDMHHIVSDGLSMELFLKEFCRMYSGSQLEPVPFQYKDFTLWQQTFLQTLDAAAQKAFWLNYLSGELSRSNLPLDFPRPGSRSFEGDCLRFTIGDEAQAALRHIAAANGATLYMVLLAVYTILIARYLSVDDVIVGTPSAGRRLPGLDGVMGMFVNTLAMRNRPCSHMPFNRFLAAVKANALQAFENQDYQFDQLVEALDISRDAGRNPIFDTMFVVNDTAFKEFRIDGLDITSLDFDHGASPFDITLVCWQGGAHLTATFEYCRKLFKKETVARLASHFLNIIQQLIDDPAILLSRINMFSPQEQRRLLVDFNSTAAEVPAAETIHRLFEIQARRWPDRTALVAGAGFHCLSYRELDRRSGVLAALLREKGIVSEAIAAVMAGRSIEVIIAILAILKAGGIYLPIDPSLPEQRIRYMLDDSRARFILHKGSDRHIFPEGCEPINIDSPIMNPVISQTLDITGLASPQPGTTPAYVIYTSGSTGRPKGVMIQHLGFVNMSWAQVKGFGITSGDRVLQFASLSFDASVSEIFMAFFSGAALVLAGTRTARTSQAFTDYVASRNITVITFPPVFLKSLNRAPLSTVRVIISAGEAADIETALFYANTGKRYFNAYGPTEASVCASFHQVRPDHCYPLCIPIGKPINNINIHILCPQGRLQPVGVPGELYISGVTLARGYLNHPELTGRRFVSGAGTSLAKKTADAAKTVMNSAANWNRFYRSGDLARWLPDGEIEFLGRIDQQVKIRGFRIELGEIKNILTAHKNVKDAVVIDHINKNGDRFLCAYLVKSDDFSSTEVRDYLACKLPDYMLPSYFIPIADIPLSVNGKVDRKALPEPNPRARATNPYAAARTDIEKILTEIWQEVLALDNIGIDDAFFELGGDSIKAVQVSSRLYSYGYKLEMTEIFHHLTIRQVAGHVKKKIHDAQQGVVSGYVAWTPIQKWFFERNFTDPHHWNQAIMLYSETGFHRDILKSTLEKLIIHHDALRMVYKRENGVMRQYNRAVAGECITFKSIDLRQPGDTPEIEPNATELQSRMNLSDGPLVKACLFKTADGDHLLLAVHHLVIDTVSWRILLDDLAAAYAAALKGEAHSFPAKTTSFKEWAEKQLDFAAQTNSPWFEREIRYWKALESRFSHPQILPADFQSVPPETMGDNDSVSLFFSQQETGLLLRDMHRPYRTKISDILLTALGLSVKQWTGWEEIAVNLEGHGRETMIEGVDVARTVGWFTTQYPVILSLPQSHDTGSLIRHIKENLRQIPHNGIGYGILRYLSPAADHLPDFSIQPQICFNYLGQLDTKGSAATEGLFAFSPRSTGHSQSLRSERMFALDLEAVVMGGKLSIELIYSKRRFQRTTIEMLAESLKSNLGTLIHHCLAIPMAGNREFPRLTPGDYRTDLIGIPQLDEMVRSTRQNIDANAVISKIYPLTPLQAGMLFHYLYEKTTSMYVDQQILELRGTVDPELFRRSVGELVRRYDVLRTVFVFEKIEQPLQVVLRERDIDVYFEDISHLTSKQRDAVFESFRSSDRARAFDLAAGPLLRVSIFRLEEDLYKTIWCFHHIIIDGWCQGIIFDELFRIYRSLADHRPVSLPDVYPYSDYIAWLGLRDRESAANFWRTYLDAYQQTAPVPVSPQRSGDGRASENYRYHWLHIDGAMVSTLEDWAKSAPVTMNVLLQSAWGILMQRYNNVDDAIFGAVVSGRAAEVEGIERMVGLFIETVPVRIRSGSDMTFREMARAVQEDSLEIRKYEWFPLAEIQAFTPLKADLIDHIMVFENYPLTEVLRDNEMRAGLGFSVSQVEMIDRTNYPFSVAVVPGERYDIRFCFDAGMYDPAFVENIGRHLLQIFRVVVGNGDIPVHAIDILPDNEKRLLLEEFNSGPIVPSPYDSIHQWFESTVQRFPHRIAVSALAECRGGFDKISVSYKELNRRADNLAHLLMEKGVGAGSIAAIMVAPSVEMMVAIMAVLKSGAAFLPIAPDYPLERIRFMLEDSSAKVLLTKRCWSGELSRLRCSFETLYLEEAPDSVQHSLHVGPSTHGDRNRPISQTPPVYTIYTSGTTGRSKGVVLLHANLVNYVQWFSTQADLGVDDGALLVSSYAFDLGYTAIFPSLLNGGRLNLIPSSLCLEPGQLLDLIYDNAVTYLKLTPSLYSMIVNYPGFSGDYFTSLRLLVLGGEAIDVDDVERTFRACPGIRIMNHYGPTEATIGCIARFIDREKIARYKSLPTIGRPINNTRVFILDKNGNPQPPGITGELWVAGAGMAAGYLNRPQLTIERFKNPANQKPVLQDLTALRPNVFRGVGSLIENGPDSSKAYRTGDMAKFLPDGNIQFLGRVDTQVKIRGYRVELGEIEKALSRYTLVDDAVVTAFGNGNLCGYYVCPEEIAAAELRVFLAADLPDYMIPNHFVRLDEIPLTPNGKTDKKALPDPGSAGAGNNSETAPPTNPVEQRLLELWCEVLGVTNFGIHDNFFHLGGDSIKAIQIASRMLRFGLRMTVKDLFENRTIAALAPLVESVVNKSEQGIICGEVALTPVQRWFFEKDFTGKHHWNMSLMLYRAGGFDATILKAVLQRLTEHHDALRMVYPSTEPAEPRQINRGLEGELFTFEEIDVTGALPPEARNKIESESSRIQAGMDLVLGPLLKACLFKTTDGDHLLLAVHHLVMDGVSWRILLEDFTGAYLGLEKNEPVSLAEKTTSFRDWANKLNEFGRLNDGTGQWAAERRYWQEIENTQVPALVPDNPVEIRCVRDSRTVTVRFGEEETGPLLTHVHRSYNTEINDILLAALSPALNRWQGFGHTAVNLEGHGRETIIDDVDISRTVGWFTTHFPVILQMQQPWDWAAQIKGTKEYLRRIPSKGIGYGILRYIVAGTEGIAAPLNPEINFNYLGRFDSELDGGLFSRSEFSGGQTNHPDGQELYAININGMVIDGKLTVEFRYDKNEYAESTVSQLAEYYKQCLLEISNHCLNKESSEMTVSDFSATDLDESELDGIYDLLEE